MNQDETKVAKEIESAHDAWAERLGLSKKLNEKELAFAKLCFDAGYLERAAE